MTESFWSSWIDLPWPVMSLGLGLVDGFNPCAMWTLMVLLGFLLSMEDTKKRIWIGAVFVGSSGIIYLLALLAYYFGFREITSSIAQGAMAWVFPIIGIISVGAGFITLKNAKQKGVDCDIRDQESKKKFSQDLSNILAREKFWMVLVGVVILAFSVNAVELLCSFVIPTTFTAKLVSLDMSLVSALSAILLYDLAYMADDIVVLTLALTTMSMKFFSEKWIYRTNLFAGTLLIIIGLSLLADSEKFVGIFY